MTEAAEEFKEFVLTMLPDEREYISIKEFDNGLLKFTWKTSDKISQESFVNPIGVGKEIRRRYNVIDAAFIGNIFYMSVMPR